MPVDSPMTDLLPEAFRVASASSPPLRALVAAADDMLRPVRESLDGLDTVVAPYRVRDDLVAYLSRWVDLDWLTLPAADSTAALARGVPVARQRDLIAAAADLSATRGTRAGMLRFLRLALGADGFEIESESGLFHLRVVVPVEAADRIDLVRRIVAAIKPAHLTHEVVVAGSGATT